MPHNAHGVEFVIPVRYITTTTKRHVQYGGILVQVKNTQDQPDNYHEAASSKLVAVGSDPQRFIGVLMQVGPHRPRTQAEWFIDPDRRFFNLALKAFPAASDFVTPRELARLRQLAQATSDPLSLLPANQAVQRQLFEAALPEFCTRE